MYELELKEDKLRLIDEVTGGKYVIGLATRRLGKGKVYDSCDGGRKAATVALLHLVFARFIFPHFALFFRLSFEAS